MLSRKTLHRSRIEKFDHVLIAWLRQRRFDGVPMSGMMLRKQAKKFQRILKIGNTKCVFSEGWLDKFKKRYALKCLKICGEKLSADNEAAVSYIDEFASIVAGAGNCLSPEQIYNADETALYWRYVPRKTLATADERAPSGFKDMKDRVTILACSNAAGKHKLNLALIGKSRNPRCLKGIRHELPVIYMSQRNAWVTQDSFIDWFHQHFVPEVTEHCRAAGLGENPKALLVLDNCPAHPPADLLRSNNISAVYLPPNVTSLLQPCDQGILRALKIKYKHFFLHKMLGALNSGTQILDFLKSFTLKDAIYGLADAWNQITLATLKNAWHKLWTATLFDSDEEEDEDFKGFTVHDEDWELENIGSYASIGTAEMEELMNIDNHLDVAQSLSDRDIAAKVLNEGIANVQ
uniref:Jerky protein-like n=1 Tax=Geotrypetes seraphini TaxID=260995 RepID=A0A6P8S7D5_GEOSA|nr:jerky protein-like [Geotrypetes seraphini]